MRKLLAVMTASSAVAAFLSGIALAVLHILDPRSSDLAEWTSTYHLLVVAFVATAVVGSAYAWITWPIPGTPAAPLSGKTEALPASKVGVAVAFKQMRTYIDLEMWELALGKAEYVLSEFPESKEAQTVAKNINELRWKAEPKFVDRAPAAPTPAPASPQEGTEQMLKHVRTYMELEMWELAKQKAVALLKNFPDSNAAVQVAPLYQEIEKRLQPVPEKKE